MLALLIPTGSDHDRARVPVAVWSLIGLNVLMFVVANLLDYDRIARAFGFVAANPQPIQFLSHMFLHMGWPTAPDAPWTDYANCLLHIGGNMAYLWFAGSDIEDVLGGLKFLALYFVSGLASALLFWATAVWGNFPNLEEPAVGASGAVSGLLGFYLMRFPRFKVRLWFCAIIPFPVIMRQGIARVSSLIFIGVWIGIQLMLGVHALKTGGAQVAYWGHIGGFFLGLLAGLVTRQYRLGEQEYLLKEADHFAFTKGKWYRAMEFYQKLAQRYPRCVEAYTKWALCLECTGSATRAEKVLRDALSHYTQQGWTTEAAAIQAELSDLTTKPEASAVAPAATAQPSPAWASLTFRRELKGKGKRHD